MRAETKTKKAKEEAEAARQELKRINEKLQKANKDLQKQTLIDGLTGIANRRYFDQVLHEEWRRAMRSNEPMSFILGDIDHFKLFNDFYGHHEGDECLRQIAETLNRLARRPGDLVARYGGEEFGIILSHTSAKDAYLLAEKARMAVLNLKLAHNPSDVSEFVTISLGVASIVPERTTSPQTLIEAADRALYRAKSGGRNQVQRENNPHPEITAVPALPYQQ
jgi:diguanylate cyclase (GGDEF)-like protein